MKTKLDKTNRNLRLAGVVTTQAAGLMRSLCVIALGARLIVPSAVAQTPITHYVNVANSTPVFPYTNWATAATNIQDAVDAATGGCTVLVTNGVYAMVTVTNPIRLESVNGPAVTTIDGVGGSRCVYLGSNAVLSGFTLTNGNAPGGMAGGGVFCENRSAVVTNCMLMGNTALYVVESVSVGDGGGAYGGTLYNCTLTGNYSSRGGGAADCTLYNCTLTDNQVYGGKSAGGGLRGGGAYLSTLHNCTLTANWSRYGGGASDSVLYNCTLTGNSAYNSGGGASGSTLYNCFLTDNDGGSDGQFFNCTIVGNNWGVSGTVFNTIIYGNTNGNYAEDAILNYCVTTPFPTNGVGNITNAPLFVDMAAGDFRLRDGSPCIDAGTNLLGLAFTNQWGELVVFGGDSTDMLGHTRFLDGNYDGTVAWDIGAYEFNPYRFTPTMQMGAEGFQFTVRGEPGRSVRIERSRDLIHWEFAGQVPIPASGQTLIDPAATREPRLFYRAVSVPASGQQVAFNAPTLKLSEMSPISFETMPSVAQPIPVSSSAQVAVRKSPPLGQSPLAVPGHPGLARMKSNLGEKVPDVEYVPTPDSVVNKMLEMASIQLGDVVYDLGCGDGRILVAAARQYGVRAVGVEIDPQMVRIARQNAATNGVSHLVRIDQADLFTADLNEASVVMLYLLPELNERLKPQLGKLRPGARIVSHDFGLRGVKPAKAHRMVVRGERGRSEYHTIFQWTAPLEFSGDFNRPSYQRVP